MRRRLLVRVLAALGVGLAVLVLATGFLYDPEPKPLRLARRQVVVEGTRLGFHQTGQGPDVVLLHGGMGSAEDFEPVLAALAAHHRVTAVDRPGFGASECRQGDATFSGNARLLAGLVRALGLTRPVIAGHSHGGGVALRLAANEPGLASGLVLIASTAYPSPQGPALLDRLVALPRVGEGLSAWLGPLLGPGQIRRTLEAGLGPTRPERPRTSSSGAPGSGWRPLRRTAPPSLPAFLQDFDEGRHRFTVQSAHLSRLNERQPKRFLNGRVYVLVFVTETLKVRAQPPLFPLPARSARHAFAPFSSLGALVNNLNA